MKPVVLNGEKIGEAESWDGVAIAIVDHAFEKFGSRTTIDANQTVRRGEARDLLAESLGVAPSKLQLTDDNSHESATIFEVAIGEDTE